LAFYLSNDADSLRTIATVYYIAAAGIAWVWVPLAVSFVVRRAKTLLSVIVCSLIPFIALCTAILLAPQSFFVSTKVSPNVIYLEHTGYTPYVIYYIVYFLIAVVILIIAHKLSIKKIEKNAVRSVLIAYIIASVIGCYFNLFLPYLGNYSYVWAGPLCLAAFMPIVGVAIARYRLFNIRLIAGRTLVFTICLVVVLTLYLLGRETLHRLEGVDFVVLDSIMTLLAAVIFYALMRYAVKSTSSVFNNALLDNKLFDSVSRLAIDNIDIQKMLDRMTKTIAKSSRSRYALIYMNVANKDFIAHSYGVSQIEKAELDAIYRVIKKRKTGVLITEEINVSEPIYGVLIANNVSVVSILCDNDTHQIIGMLIIGQEKPTLYSDKEIMALSAICDVIVIAVRNSELSMMDKTKDEFMSLASHQLRTPLTSIQGYTSMVAEGDFGEINKEQAHALEEVVSSARRMAVLINDLLNVSRMQSGKFVISRTKTKMVELVHEEIEQVQFMASSHEIELVYDDENWGDIPEVSIDRAKIGEVMANLIDNAIFYSRHNSKVKISLVQSGGDVEFRVEDSGIGVPKKDQADLFTKFFRASNARTIRPDGTGIGLFLAKKVITDHGGSIIFKSVEGKGSTFGFSLPLDK
jgi:signal transduction histidine kinase